jgi:hypothetical protein
MFESLITFFHRSRKTLFLIVVTVIVTVVLTTAISVLLDGTGNVRFPSVGTIRTINYEAYGGDMKQRDALKYLDWGTIYTGTSANRSFYLNSTSNVATILNVTAGNWTFFGLNGINASDYVRGNLTFPLDNYLNLTCDFNNKTINPEETINITVTLSISNDWDFINALVSNRVQDFSFDMTIQPSE